MKQILSLIVAFMNGDTFFTKILSGPFSVVMPKPI